MVLGGIIAASGLIASVSYGAVKLLTYDLYGQQAAKFYRSGDMPYVQLSCFIDEDAGFDYNSVVSARETIAGELTNASVSSPESAGENARLYIDAYSLEYDSRISTPEEELISAGFEVTVTAVGGEFFGIHRLGFISGQPFYDGDYLTDRVVVDELCAWRLYGASDIAGMTLMLGGKRYEIAGVVKTDDYESYGIKPRIYIPYAAYSSEGYASVTCYEAVLPEQITGFGESAVKKAVGLGDGQYILKDNSARYELMPLLDNLDGYFARGTRSDRIYFPHWENNALTIENQCTLWALSAAVSGICAGLAAVILVMASMLRLSKFLSELRERHRR